MNDTIAALRANLSARQATRLDSIRGRFDGWLLAIAGALACLGVVMVGSSSVAQDSDAYGYLVKHLVFLGVGLVAALVVSRVELKFIEKHSHWLLPLCLLLLLVVLVPGIGASVKGARRWIRLGVANFQVVEAVKVLFIVWLASYLKRYSEEVTATWKAMLKPLGVVGLLVALLLLQPDFGSSMLLIAVAGGMLVLGGVNMPRMFVPVAMALPAIAFIAMAAPYRMRRLTSFVNPFADPFGEGYQLANALMAVGRGEWFGVGLGASVQKLSYLPEAHTDFILAVIAEELGFAGVCLVVALYAGLVGRALWLGLKCVEMRRHFAGYIAFGIALWMGMQSFVSIGVNLGMLPTKGLTLPLISYGGSSVAMTCAAIGLLLRVSYEYDRARRQVARLRGDAQAGAPTVPPVVPPVLHGAARPAAVPAPRPAEPARASVAPARGTSRLRDRIEPTFGRFA